jgi:hypothetical protein
MIDYRAIRGFNYQPSYAGSLAMIWTNFDRAAWDREVGWSKRFGTTMLRVWLDWHAWVAMQESFYDRVEEALGVLGAHGVTMMPVLFNRWNDRTWPMGMVNERDLASADWSFTKFRSYVDGLMKRFGADRRVAIWDLCNEPQAPHRDAETNLREAVWLSHVAGWVRAGSKVPVTIGTMNDDNVRIYAPLQDVISFHPYCEGPGKMEERVAAAKSIGEYYGKPILCTEACKGSFNDAKRGAQAREDIGTLERHGIGWIVWQLMAGRFITGNKERTDNNALDFMEGYMPFLLEDGTTRPGHEWLERAT